MRKINIAPRLSALVATLTQINEASRSIYAAGYSFGSDPVAYWFPSVVDQLAEDIEHIQTAARALPGAQDPRHGRDLAALRVALGNAEKHSAAVLADYTLALRMAQAMERPAGSSLTYVIQLSGQDAVRRAVSASSGFSPRWVD